MPPLYTFPPKSQASDRLVADHKVASDDPVLPRLLDIYIPSAEHSPHQSIHDLSRLALSPNILADAVDAERNQPTLKSFSTFGQENRDNPLQTSHGWKALKKVGQQVGVVAVSYEDDALAYNRRVHQFGLGHVWVCTATMTGCPMSMTDGAAKLLAAHLGDADGDQPGFQCMVQETYRRLVSREPAEAWTAGQWMTERTGGSDVSGTETMARRLTEKELAADTAAGRHLDANNLPLGPWLIDGFKWFSSATDSDVALMLARTEKGIGLFLAPLRRARRTTLTSMEESTQSQMNGIRIHRLKEKIGTKSLPTAELELKNVRAWLIGQEGKGVKEISTILNLTRLHTAASSVGSWARGLQICRAYSRARQVRGGLLQDNPQHLHWMANNVVNYVAAAHFSFFGVAMLGALEQDWHHVIEPTHSARLIPNDKGSLSIILRLLTPVIKAQVSVSTVHALREHMECLGGVGYCENNEDGGVFNISRVFRDILVNPIWEGTVSVMAEDVVRVLCDDRLGDGRVLQNIFAPWVRQVQANYQSLFVAESAAVESLLKEVIAIEGQLEQQELLFRGRDLLWYFEAITCGILLLFDASIDQDDVATAIAQRWIKSKTSPHVAIQDVNLAWRSESALDRNIFLGKSSHGSAGDYSKL